MATGGRDESQAMGGVLSNGTLVPNRIFVGGLTNKTNEEDLRNLFSMYGNVKATKIVFDRAGSSRGYGFVTFETDDEARKVLATLKGKDLYLKEKKLNIAPAFKKHQYNRSREPGSLNAASVVWASHPFTGSAGFSAREQAYYPQGSWPLLWHQPVYMPQQYPYSQFAQSGYPQYVCNVAPTDYQYSSSSQAQGSDFSETASADSGDSGRNRSRPSTPAPAVPEFDRNRPQSKPGQDQNVCMQKTSSGCASPSTYVHSSPVQPLHHHVLAKTVNGMTVMAYPAQYVMGSPTLVQMKEGTSDSDNVMFDLGYMHSQMASGALTPPATPMASMSCDFNVNTSIESSRKS